MDIEKAKEIHSSVLWEQICQEIDVRIRSLESSLRVCLPVDLERIQTEIKIWEKVKRLPQDVIDREE